MVIFIDRNGECPANSILRLLLDIELKRNIRRAQRYKVAIVHPTHIRITIKHSVRSRMCWLRRGGWMYRCGGWSGVSLLDSCGGCATMSNIPGPCSRADQEEQKRAKNSHSKHPGPCWPGFCCMFCFVWQGCLLFEWRRGSGDRHRIWNSCCSLELFPEDFYRKETLALVKGHSSLQNLCQRTRYIRSYVA